MKTNYPSILLLWLLSISGACQSNEQTKSFRQEQIIDKYLKKGAWRHHFLEPEWEEWIVKGLNEDSTIAYLWQQRALPHWKTRRYQKATEYYKKAIQYDRATWLGRLGYLQSIFTKDYIGALQTFKAYRQEFGPGFDQDHSHEFYEALCHLQLGDHTRGHNLLSALVLNTEKKSGESWVHFMEYFYLGVTQMEIKKYKEALLSFDKTLKVYPQFSDAKYYKARCLRLLGSIEEANRILKEGKTDYLKGYTITEDGATYEPFPYQITWQWKYVKE